MTSTRTLSEFRFKRAEIYFAADQFSMARREIDNLIDKTPEKVIYQALRAQIFVATGYRKLAKQDIRRVIKLDAEFANEKLKPKFDALVKKR